MKNNQLKLDGRKNYVISIYAGVKLGKYIEIVADWNRGNLIK